MSLPHHVRMVGKRAFRNVFEQPIVSSDTRFRVLARPTGMGFTRLGMAISRKVDRKAVARNRLKRVIRESFRAHYGTEASPAALDIVVLPRREAVALSNRQLLEALEQHWRRLDRRMEGMAAEALRATADVTGLPAAGCGESPGEET